MATNTAPGDPYADVPLEGGQEDEPSSVAAERAVLGIVLAAGGDELDRVPLLEPDHFWLPQHGDLFARMRRMHADGEPVSLLSVAASIPARWRMGQRTAGLYLHDLIEGRPPGTADYYAEIVATAAGSRELVVLGRRIQQIGTDAAEVNAGELADRRNTVQQLVDAALESRRSHGPVAVADVLPGVVRSLTDRQERISSPWAEMDRYLQGGLARGWTYIIGARTSVGKSAMGSQWATHVAAQDWDVLISSMEMPVRDLVIRMLSQVGQIEFGTLQDPLRMSQDVAATSKVVDAQVTLSEYGLYVTDGADQTVASIRADAKAVAKRGRLGLVVVDYVQLLDPAQEAKGGRSREQEIASNSRALKKMALTLDVPVVALAQLNREHERGQRRSPRLTDLRESGALEADADVVVLLDRDLANPETRHQMTVHIAKNRNGPLGEFEATFRGHHCEITPNDVRSTTGPYDREAVESYWRDLEAQEREES